MNERLLDICIKAGINTWPFNEVGFISLDESELVKFAELMVEEACQAFWSEACNVSDLAYEDYHRNSKKIRQHFGVE